MRSNLERLRGIAVATAAMVAGIVAVKLLLLGRVPDAILLAAEIISGAATYAVALLLVERSLFREIVDLFAQALPGNQVSRSAVSASATSDRPEPATVPTVADEYDEV